MKEQAYLYELHPKLNRVDPLYSPHLAQNRADFSFNFEEGRNVRCIVREEKLDLQESHNLQCNLDNVSVGPYLIMEGWCFVKGADNEELQVEYILKNEMHSYVITTQKRYRGDVVNCFQNEKNIEFSGVFCEVNKVLLAKGECAVYMLVKDMVQKVGECRI